MQDAERQRLQKAATEQRRREELERRRLDVEKKKAEQNRWRRQVHEQVSRAARQATRHESHDSVMTGC